MGAAEDFAGARFARLVGISVVGKNKHGVRLWSWRCDCGNEITRPSAHIKEGRQVSCGCYKDEQSRLRVKHGKSGSRTYRAWIEMKARCRGKDEPSRTYYVRRGIKVCRQWARSFERFLADMGECPDGMTLERIKNNEGYAPENCRWALQSEQLRNTRRTVRVVVAERQMCLKDACAAIGANYDRVRSRIRSGKSPQMALEMG